MPDGSRSMSDGEYAERLVKHSQAWWKRLIGAQAPYRFHIRRIVQGRVLDVGCGIGRNLLHLEGDGVGVDVNREAVRIARDRGLEVYTTSEFSEIAPSLGESFDSLLFAHVLEHMSKEESRRLVADYLPHLRPGGRVVVIVPQSAGFASDPTHVDFVGEGELEEIAASSRLAIDRIYSFPLPGWAGRWFRHNETVALMRKP